MNNGSVYLLTAREVEDPTRKLEAAKAVLVCFVQYHSMSVGREEVNIMISDAHSLAAAAQKQLDKPWFVKVFEFVRELIVTG